MSTRKRDIRGEGPKKIPTTQDLKRLKEMVATKEPCGKCAPCEEAQEHNWNDGVCNDCGIRDPLFEGLNNAPDHCPECDTEKE